MNGRFNRLRIHFIEETYEVDPGDTLSFGREADVIIDENEYLHRVAGEFRYESGGWTLDNLGTRIVLFLHGKGKAIPTTLPPGQQARLIDDEWCVKFQAGPTKYELVGSSEPAASQAAENSSGVGTLVFAPIELSDNQRIAVVALSQHFLRGDLNPVVPANKEIAQQVGSSDKAIQRKIDEVSKKLTKAGVPGLKGSQGASSPARRLRLVEHLVREGIVTVDNLNLLD